MRPTHRLLIYPGGFLVFEKLTQVRKGEALARWLGTRSPDRHRPRTRWGS